MSWGYIWRIIINTETITGDRRISTGPESEHTEINGRNRGGGGGAWASWVLD